MTTLDALQTALAAEHAAVHVLGSLGARVSLGEDPVLRSALDQAYTVHRGRRDVLTRWVRDEGAAPVPAEPSYALPRGDEATAARALEDGCAATYAWLVAQTVGDQRRWAVESLADAAIRGPAFRGSPEIFPGVGGYADR